MLLENESKLLFIGDSISDYGRARPVGGLNGWGTGYVNLVGGMLTAFAPEKRISVVNMGVSGDTIRCLAARWEQDVIAQRPDTVAVMIGVNDVWRHFDSYGEDAVSLKEYEETYRGLISKTLKIAKRMVLMSPFYVVSPEDPMRKMLAEYQNVVRRLAEEYGCVFVDVQAAFDAFSRVLHPMFYATDRVHPNANNPTGAFVIAGAFLKAVGFTGEEW